ncbi:MAG: DUF4238 domain-containing protein [Candidatus Lokiarchaeota archaeon]|nr:DUF4238 domain-containing protein [Candidatus Lokiarchaeota archaeon]
MEHLKKHIKALHPEEFNGRYKKDNEDRKIKRSHTCPVVYLQNFAKVSDSYYQKLLNFDKNSYREPKRNEFLIYAHDKIENSALFNTSLNNIGVKKNFYSSGVEKYLESLENNVGKQFRKIRNMALSTFINSSSIFRFIMCQLIRTPKFQEKIRKDQLFLRDMNEEDFQRSIMRGILVQKPEEVTQKSLKKIHEDFIMNNLLETIYKWSTISLVTNNTDIPFITSDCPVVYKNAEFFPSYLNREKHIAFSIIIVPDTVNFFFPIDPRYAFLINNFDNNKKEVTIRDEDIFDEELIMTMNMLEYQHSERFIYLKDNDEELVKKIRNKCGDKLNIEYQSMEYSYKVIKEEREMKNISKEQN